jgi:hypothetical protein
LQKATTLTEVADLLESIPEVDHFIIIALVTDGPHDGLRTNPRVRSVTRSKINPEYIVKNSTRLAHEFSESLYAMFNRIRDAARYEQAKAIKHID